MADTTQPQDNGRYNGQPIVVSGTNPPATQGQGLGSATPFTAPDKTPEDSGLTWKGMGASAKRGGTMGISAKFESPEEKKAYQQFSSKNPVTDLAIQTTAAIGAAALATKFPGTKSIAAAEWTNAAGKVSMLSPIIKQAVTGAIYGGAVADDDNSLGGAIENAIISGALGMITPIAGAPFKAILKATGVDMPHIQAAVEHLKDAALEHHMTLDDLVSKIKAIREGGTPMMMGEAFTNKINKMGQNSPLLIPEIQAKAAAQAMDASKKALTAFTKQKSPLDEFTAQKAKINKDSLQAYQSHLENAKNIPIKMEGKLAEALKHHSNINEAIIEVQNEQKSAGTFKDEVTGEIKKRPLTNFYETKEMSSDFALEVQQKLRKWKTNASNPNAVDKNASSVTSSELLGDSQDVFTDAIEHQNEHLKLARETYADSAHAERTMDNGRLFLLPGEQEVANNVKIDAEYFKKLKPFEVNLFQQGMMAHLSSEMKNNSTPGAVLEKMKTEDMQDKLKLVFGARSTIMNRLIKNAESTINGAKAVDPRIGKTPDELAANVKAVKGGIVGIGERIYDKFKATFPEVPNAVAKLVVDASMNEGGLDKLLADKKITPTMYVKAKELVRKGAKGTGEVVDKATNKVWPIEKKPYAAPLSDDEEDDYKKWRAQQK